VQFGRRTEASAQARLLRPDYAVAGETSPFHSLSGVGQFAVSVIVIPTVVRSVRDQLVADLVANSRGKISIVQPDGHWRPRLRLPNRSLVSLYVCPSFRNRDAERRWCLNPVSREQPYVSLIARLNIANDAVQDCFLLPDLQGRTRWTMSPDDVGLKPGKQLRLPADLISVVEQVRDQSRRVF
jgi:hypothetical protein